MDLLDREKSSRGGGFAKKKEIQDFCLLIALLYSQKSEYWSDFILHWGSVEKI
jgi:hypothetical protein